MTPGDVRDTWRWIWTCRPVDRTVPLSLDDLRALIAAEVPIHSLWSPRIRRERRRNAYTVVGKASATHVRLAAMRRDLAHAPVSSLRARLRVVDAGHTRIVGSAGWPAYGRAVVGVHAVGIVGLLVGALVAVIVNLAEGGSPPYALLLVPPAWAAFLVALVMWLGRICQDEEAFLLAWFASVTTPAPDPAAPGA